MLSTKAYQTKARVTPARQRSGSAKRATSLNTTQRSNSQNQHPKRAQDTSGVDLDTTGRSTSQGRQKSNTKHNKPTKGKKAAISAVPFLEQSPTRLNIQIRPNEDLVSDDIGKIGTERTLQTIQSACSSPLPESFEIARLVFLWATHKYGSRLTHKQVDSVIRKSEFAQEASQPETRHLIKSLLFQYEKNGGDTEKALQIEIVRQRCSKLSDQHRRYSLLSKSFFCLVREVIETKQKDPFSYYQSGSLTNTTLNRMLEGVISVSKQSQLDEFIQLERTLQTQMSETLTSEPDLQSHRESINKPPLAKRLPPSNLQTFNTNSEAKLLSGVQSPSVNDLVGETFPAFCDEQSVGTARSSSVKKILIEGNLVDPRILPASQGPTTALNKDTGPVMPFFQNEATFGKSSGGGDCYTTHLKIAQLFHTAEHSHNNSLDTQVDEQLKRLEGTSSTEVTHSFQNRMLMASYVRKQTLLTKAFSAWQDEVKVLRKERQMRRACSSSQEKTAAQKRSKRAGSQDSQTSFKSKSKKKVSKTVSSLKERVQYVKHPEHEAPVRPTGSTHRVATSVSTDKAPNFQSCLSSPKSRLQSILTDKHVSSAIEFSHETARRMPSPIRPEQQWLDAGSRHLLHLEQSGFLLRLKSLKRQVFKSLEYNVHVTRLHNLRADAFVQRRALNALRRFIFEKKRRQAYVALYAQQKCERLVVEAFRNWRGLFFESQVVVQFRQQSLLKRGFEYLLSATVHVQQSRQISIVCREHFQQKALRRFLEAWKQRATEKRPTRVLTKRVTEHMSCFRQQKWLKAWFNQIDILKHEQALKRDLLASRARRLKRNYFVVWLTKYLKIAKRRDRLEKLARFSQENFARTFFKPWLLLATKRLNKRQAFFEMRARHLMRKGMGGLRQNVYNSNSERHRVRNVVLLRATRLIKTAFYEGFVSYARQRVISRQRKILASSHFHAKGLIKSFKALLENTTRGRKAKGVKVAHNFVVEAKFFSEWLSLAKNMQKAKKLRTKHLIEKQFRVLKALYEHAGQTKVHQTIVSHCLKNYSLRLLRTAIASFTQNISVRQAKRGIAAEVEEFYERKLRAKVVESLQYNCVTNKENARLVFNFRVTWEDNYVAHAFRKLQANRDLKQFKRSYLPFLETREARTRAKCFIALREWKVFKRNQRQLLGSHLTTKNSRLIETAFEGLWAYAQVSKEKKEMQIRANLQRRTTLLDKAIQTLGVHTICQQNQKALTQEVEKIRRKSFFITWFNLVHADLPKQRQADEFYLRHKFEAMRGLTVRNRGLRAKQRLLKSLAQEYYPYMLKKRGVCKWKRVADRASFVASCLEKAQKNRLRKLFDSWWNSLDQMAASKSRHIMQRELNKRFQFRRALTALRIYCEEKRHERVIIQTFQAKHGMVEKAKVFSAIVTLNYHQRVSIRDFIERMRPRGTNLLHSAFQEWRKNLSLARKDDMADLFYQRRATKFVLRRCFERLRLAGSLFAKQDLKRGWLDKMHNNALMRRCFVDLCVFAQKSGKLRRAWQIMKPRSDQRLKLLALQALQTNKEESKRLNGIEGAILKAFNKIRLRKVIIAMQSHTAIKVKAKIVSAKWALRVKDKFLSRWQEQHVRAQKVNRLASILQEQNYLTFIRAFMLKLQDAGNLITFTRELDVKRRVKAWAGFKQNWLLAKMSHSLVLKHNQELLRKALVGLRMAQIDRIGLRETISQQVDIQSAADRLESLRQCFEALREHRFKKRASRIARSSFGLCLLRRAYASLKTHNLRQKMLKVNFEEVIVLRKQRFLRQWVAVYDKVQREREAGAIINFDRVHTVLQAWKRYTLNQKLVRQFRTQTYEKSLKRTLLASLQKNVIIEHFQRMMYVRIKERQDAELKRDAFTALRAGTKLRSIQNNMLVYHSHKFKQRVVDAWRSVVARNNKRRLNLIKQRAAFHERPYLARPLLALKNLLVFRAFRSIVLNASRNKEIKFNRQICTYSIYLRLQRKAFYALRLNAAARFQHKKSKEIKRLMIQRRWFTYLKRVTQMQKRKRKLQTEAAIFRFLSLQRRGLLQWVSFVSKIKRVQIKRTYALTLYYNRVCDKVLTALKVNAAVKARKRRENSQATGYITTSSSEIMHEASFTHRSKLNLSSLQHFANNSTQNLKAEEVLTYANKELSSETRALRHGAMAALAQGASPDEIEASLAYEKPKEQLPAYHNFYQQPIDQVELACNPVSEVNPHLPQNVQEQQERAMYTQQMTRKIQPLDCRPNMLIVPTTLPTPQANGQLHGDFQMSSNQQLTLGTMAPINQIPHGLGGAPNGQDDSYQTQQWSSLPHPQQQQTLPVSYDPSCHLCLSRVDHQSHETAQPYQNEQAYIGMGQTPQEIALAKILNSEEHTLLQPNVQQTSSFMDYKEDSSDKSNMASYRAALASNAPHRVYDDERPERDPNSHKAANPNANSQVYLFDQRQPSSHFADTDQDLEQQMLRDSASQLFVGDDSSLLMQELGGTEDAGATAQTVQRRIQFNLNKMTVLQSHDFGTSSMHSTPDINMNHQIQIQQMGGGGKATRNLEANLTGAWGSEVGRSDSQQQRLGSQVYSHTSSLKTTPGQVRGTSVVERKNRAAQQHH